MTRVRAHVGAASTWHRDAEYRNFSARVWNGFSVRLPSLLAMRAELAPTVHALDYDVFYWPPWNPWGIAQLYRTPTCIMAEQQAVHLWETKVDANPRPHPHPHPHPHPRPRPHPNP